MRWRTNFLARQATPLSSVTGISIDLTGVRLCHDSFPATKCDIACKHKNCIVSNTFPKSHVYWAQGAKCAQQQQPGAGASCQNNSCHLCLWLPVLLHLPWSVQKRAAGQIYSVLSACFQLLFFSACSICWQRDLKPIQKAVAVNELWARKVVLVGSAQALLQWSLLQLVIDMRSCLVYNR